MIRRVLVRRVKSSKLGVVRGGVVDVNAELLDDTFINFLQNPSPTIGSGIQQIGVTLCTAPY